MLHHTIKKYGFEDNGMLVVVDNGTGNIYIEDYKTEEYEWISNSIMDLILDLRFRDEAKKVFLFFQYILKEREYNE